MIKDNILIGHHSPETAYVVEDYPYGFRLRCKIRYWTEYKRGHGCRMVSQTTNPKHGNIWNTTKASTFARFGLVMLLNAEGHVVNGAQLTEYCDCQQAVDFAKLYMEALPCDEARQLLSDWVARKLAFNEQKAKGLVSMNMTTTINGGKSTVETRVLQAEEVVL